MGATTWTYPQDSLTFEELQAVVLAYRRGLVTTYDLFLDEVKSFKAQPVPEIGSKWPRSGYFLPSTQTFADSVTQLASTATLKGVFRQ
jgi:hypothetical protein